MRGDIVDQEEGLNAGDPILLNRRDIDMPVQAFKRPRSLARWRQQELCFLDAGWWLCTCLGNEIHQVWCHQHIVQARHLHRRGQFADLLEDRELVQGLPCAGMRGEPLDLTGDFLPEPGDPILGMETSQLQVAIAGEELFLTRAHDGSLMVAIPALRTFLAPVPPRAGSRTRPRDHSPAPSPA